jgi:hypothetical protein
MGEEVLRCFSFASGQYMAGVYWGIGKVFSNRFGEEII